MTGRNPRRERRTTARGGRRRSGEPTVTTIYWRDIPAQLTARAGGEQQKLLLHARFQHAIDRAAAVAGLTATNDYVQEWRSDSAPLEFGGVDGVDGVDGDIGIAGVDAQLDRLCADIEAAYPRDRLESIVANGGIDPSSDPSAQPEESS